MKNPMTLEGHNIIVTGQHLPVNGGCTIGV